MSWLNKVKQLGGYKPKFYKVSYQFIQIKSSKLVLPTEFEIELKRNNQTDST